MRVNQKLAILAVLALAVGACKGEPKLPPVPPRTSPTPVVVPPNPTPAPARPTGTEYPVLSDYEQIRAMSDVDFDNAKILTDIYFDYDQADLREADRAALSRNAETLKKYDFKKVSIEGHADERGTVEYNLALSDRRARVVYDYLVSVGVPAGRLKVVAYGKEIPVCSESNEDCWQRNRRAHFASNGNQ
jgi:peptidoglycan-associated lipoprotein